MDATFANDDYFREGMISEKQLIFEPKEFNDENKQNLLKSTQKLMLNFGDDDRDKSRAEYDEFHLCDVYSRITDILDVCQGLANGSALKRIHRFISNCIKFAKQQISSRALTID